MSIDPSEAAEEEYYERLYDSLREVAIDEFSYKRQRDYYLKRPDLAVPVLQIYADAEALLQSDPRASFLLGAIAVEVTLKRLILRPIVSGLVVDDSFADLISAAATKSGIPHLKQLLLKILSEFGGVDLHTTTRPGSTRSLWNEAGDIRGLRNSVMHEAGGVTLDHANLSLLLGKEFLEVVFPSALESVRLELDGGLIRDSGKVAVERLTKKRDA